MKNFIIVAAIAVLSSCTGQNTLPGQPGDLYECKFLSVWADCPGKDPVKCCAFKVKGTGHIIKYCIVPPEDDVTDFVLILDRATLLHVLGDNECRCPE